MYVRQRRMLGGCMSDRTDVARPKNLARMRSNYISIAVAILRRSRRSAGQGAQSALAARRRRASRFRGCAGKAAQVRLIPVPIDVHHRFEVSADDIVNYRRMRLGRVFGTLPRSAEP
jgi:hypothetical protein